MTLQEYVEAARARFTPSNTSPDWESSEELAWAVQDYCSSWEPTDADRAWLAGYDPELLSLLDEDD